MEQSKYYTEKKAYEPLYEHEDQKIYPSHFVKALKDAGINEGDTVFVHSRVSAFGKLLALDKHFLMQSLIGSIKDAVGIDGTIIMPTFSYSFDKNEAFDADKTQSTVGSLTEFFRKQDDVVRTRHPNHSVAIWGANKYDLSNIGEDTFDENSIFGKLHKLNSKIIFFGAPFQSCTFIHYIEQMHQVPYRHMKKFSGKITVNGNEHDEEITFYNKYSVFFSSFSRLEKHLLEKGIMKNAKVGAGNIMAVKCKDLFDEGYNLLDKDIFFFLKNKPIIFDLFNKLSYPFLRYFPLPIKILDKLVSKFLLR
ncbi:aminoglycoside N(3)-acetyltransferase [Candidatus Woesearchaeota archaeon]|nr:aminoglycoside N(3)-acetyltransferase [Candidatus Woesearchaeota archaeon]